MANEIAKKKDNAVADLSLFAGTAGLGFGDTSETDFIIPRIGVVQTDSKTRKQNSDKYIDGAEVGDIVDTAMGKILAKAGESLNFLFTHREKEVCEWRPDNGGIVASEKLLETMVTHCAAIDVHPPTKKGVKYEFRNEEGNTLVETWQMYGILLDYEPSSWILFPFTGSKITDAKPWFTNQMKNKMPDGGQAPIFWKSCEISTYLFVDDSGRDWFRLRVKEGNPMLEHPDRANEFIESAIKMEQMVVSGEASSKVKGGDEDDKNTDEIPF